MRQVDFYIVTIHVLVTIGYTDKVIVRQETTITEVIYIIICMGLLLVFVTG